MRIEVRLSSGAHDVPGRGLSRWRPGAAGGVSAAVTSSGFSSSTMCPASGTTTNSALRQLLHDQLAVLLRDHLVLVAGEHQRRDPRAAAPASRCGPGRRAPGRTPRSRRPGCRRSSRRRSGPAPGSTSAEANDSERVAAETRSAAIRRVRSANARAAAHRPGGHREDRGPHAGEQLGQAEVQVGQVAAGRGDQRRRRRPAARTARGAAPPAP